MDKSLYISIYRYILIVVAIKYTHMKLNTKQREVIKETAKHSLKLAWTQMKEFNRDNNARARRAVQSKKLATLFN